MIRIRYYQVVIPRAEDGHVIELFSSPADVKSTQLCNEGSFDRILSLINPAAVLPPL